MSTATPLLLVAPDSVVARLNPVAKLVAAFVVLAGLLLTVDVVTPSLILAVELAALAASGLRWRGFVRRLWPLLVAAAGLALSTVLFTDVSGGTLVLAAGPLHVRTNALLAGAGVALRILAIALPGIFVFASTDPTDFADALVQQLHAPPRFTFGALAAFRLLPLLSQEWQTIGLARRARGVDAGRSPVRRLRLFASAVFALLVAAIRRGVRLATAMEARGFGRQAHRTVARPQRIRGRDRVVIAASVAVVGGATATSLLLGTWQFLFW